MANATQLIQENNALSVEIFAATATPAARQK
jgi:hypothetical protein